MTTSRVVVRNVPPPPPQQPAPAAGAGDHRHRYGQRRFKAMYFLSLSLRPLTVTEWAYFTGLGHASLANAVRWWVRYRYIGRHTSRHGYRYSLLKKGRKYVDRAYFIGGARRPELIEEMVAYQRSIGLLDRGP